MREWSSTQEASSREGDHPSWAYSGPLGTHAFKGVPVAPEVGSFAPGSAKIQKTLKEGFASPAGASAGPRRTHPGRARWGLRPSSWLCPLQLITGVTAMLGEAKLLCP